MNLVFNCYAELKLRCQGLSTWLQAAVAAANNPSSWDDLHPADRAGVEPFEPRLMMSTSPVIAAPASASTDENTSLVFSSANGNTISLTDAGAGSNADSMTITATHGTLTLTSTSGLTFTLGAASGSSSDTFLGTVANINAAINGIKFVPTSGYSGAATMQFSVTDPVDSSSASATTDLTIVPVPPTVATPASATPNPVTGTTTALNVLGADDAGASTLTYTWATTGTAPAPVTFSANGTNAAKNTTATFTKAGTYDFQVTITDAIGLTVPSSVSVTVDQTLSEIVVLPSIVSIPVSTTQQCTAAGYDQFGDVMATQPTYTWSVTGGGSVNQSGFFTAPAASGDYPVVKVTSGSCVGLAQFIAVASVADVVPPGANTGTTASDSISGYSSSYIYTWSVLSSPAGAPTPTFSPNGTTAAYSTVVTFYQAGFYQYVLNFGNANGTGTRYCATFEATIEQAATAVSLSPTSAALHENGTQPFSATATDQFGNAMSPEPAFTWTKTSGVGSIGSSGLYTAPYGTGSANIKATTGSSSASASITVTNAPPTVATPAAANPSPATGTTTALSVLGADDGGESNLTYTWATTGTPPAPVTFSKNGTNAAQDTTATFTKAGSYTFVVTIKDAGGLTTTSSTPVTVSQTLTTITVSPTAATLNANHTQQFTAAEYDQFGNAMSSPPAVTWAVASGVGSVGTGGLYTSSYGSGSANVTATSGSVSGSASVTVTNTAPTIATAATASPSTVTGTTAALSVLGGDDGGESNLTYTWATTGTAPAAVVFSANGNNAAKNTTATFAQSGTYHFKVTITDAGALTTTSTVPVVVSQTLSAIVVSPATSSLDENQTQQFTAVANDQFGDPMTITPAFTWSKVNGIGTINSSGLYTSPAAAGPATVTANSGSVSGSASATVTNAPPTVATRATANPSPVTGATTALSVLGADDGGGSNLTYSWAVFSRPAGAPAPSFSVNGANAAKSTTATFGEAGNYTLVATITDAGGLSTTSSVSVTVDQTLTSIAVSPSNPALGILTIQQFTATALDQFGQSMPTQPSFTWTATSGLMLPTGLFTSSILEGPATITATSGIVSGSTMLSVAGSNTAVASPSTVTGNTTTLSVTNGATIGVTYSWSVLSEPNGAADPTFSNNDSSTAQSTTATFFAAGNYIFQVAINAGATTTQTVSVTVDQTLSTIDAAPTISNLNENGQQAFSAVGFDQFNKAMLIQPSFSWSVASGGGAIDGSGLYTAAGSGGTGPATIDATSGSVVGSANVTVTNAAPTIATIAAASPFTVYGTTTLLSVVGADDGGESNLAYFWSTIGTPPAVVAFSANDTNAAQNTTATFTEAGSYQFLVTITDVEGASVTSSANVTVAQTLTRLALTPASPTVVEGESQQFTASATDQFDDPMATPALLWSVPAGTGSITTDGLYNAASTSGITTVKSASGSVSTTATITVPNEPPTLAVAAVASPALVTGSSTLLSVLGADDNGESNLTYTWSTTGTSPAPVEFSANASNAAKNATAYFSHAGDYQFLVTITDTQGLSVTSTADVTVNQTLTAFAISPTSATVVEGASEQLAAIATDQFGNAMTPPSLLWSINSGIGSIDSTGLYTAPSTFGSTVVSASSGGFNATATIIIPNEPPTVATAAAASANPIVGTSTTLSVLGTDDGGESNLTYTWNTTGTPPAAVEFAVNTSNAAKNTIATFTKAGNYQFIVTINDQQGLSVVSNVGVTVDQTLTGLAFSPPSATVAEGASQLFSAVAEDQFGNLIAAPSLTWSVDSGGGTIDTAGLFTAGNIPGPVIVSASGGSVRAIASVSVPNEPPTVATAAAASPSQVTGTSTALSVLGADDTGEPNLTYTWSAIGTPPAHIRFSSNGTNAAKDTTAIFSAAGNYDLLVTITDAGGLTVTSSVNIEIVAVLSSVKVSPADVAIGRGQTVQFSATACDQFGTALAVQPAFTWSTIGIAGSIDSSGLYTAPTAGNGSVTVLATTANVGSANVSGTGSLSLVDGLSASVPTSVSALPGLPVLFAGSDAILVNDSDPNTAGVPASITVSATHGTVSLSSISGLSFLPGDDNEGTLLTFAGNLADLDKALRGMAFISDAGFAGTASLTITINETGGGNTSRTFPIDVEVKQSTNSLANGGSVATNTGASASNNSQTLTDVVNTNSTAPGQSTDSPATYSGNATVSSNSFGEVVIDGSSVSPAPSPSPSPAIAHAAPPAAPAKPAVQTPPPAPANGASNSTATPVASAREDAPPSPARGAAIPDVRIDSVPEQVFPFLAKQSEMSKQMDDVAKELASGSKTRFAAGSASVVSLGASAAYFVWLLRGGSLLSSMLSIFPAWKSIDPLPVLDNFESRKRRKARIASDKESLESMVDKSNLEPINPSTDGDI